MAGIETGAIGKNKVTIWETSSGRQLRSVYPPHMDNTCGIAFSPDEQYLLTGTICDSTNAGIRQWRISDGSLVRIFECDAGTAAKIIISPYQKKMLSWQIVDGEYGRNKLNIWDFENAGLLHSVTTHYRESIAFSEDARYVLTSSFSDSIAPPYYPNEQYSGEVRLWEIPGSGSAVNSVTLHSYNSYSGFPEIPHPVALSPDNKYAAWGNVDKVLLWDLKKQRLIHTFELDSAWVNVIAFFSGQCLPRNRQWRRNGPFL